MIVLKEHRWHCDPIITEQEILAHAHDPTQHIGNAPHFTDLLKFLLSVHAFGQGVSQSKVPFLLYEDGEYIPPTKKQAENRKKGTFFCNRRFQQISPQSGKGSFTCREGQYFHDIFRQHFGDLWAEAVTARELILQPIGQTLDTLAKIQIDWENLDALSALRILDTLPRPSSSLQLSVHPLQNTRWSQQGDDVPLCNPQHALSIPVGTHYQLRLSGVPKEKTVLMIEFCAHPLRHGHHLVQAQVLQHHDRTDETVYFTDSDGQPLKILDHVGHFGYWALVLPPTQHTESLFGPSMDKHLLSPHDLKTIIAMIYRQRQSHAIDWIVLNYHVIPAQRPC